MVCEKEGAAEVKSHKITYTIRISDNRKQALDGAREPCYIEVICKKYSNINRRRENDD